MDSIEIRYGESLTLPIDTGDINDVSASIYIGKPGEVYVLEKSATLTDGVGEFVFEKSDTAIPLDTYYYQINTVDSDGYTQKFPSPETYCSGDDINFPKFIVGEALDVQEIS